MKYLSILSVLMFCFINTFSQTYDLAVDMYSLSSEKVTFQIATAQSGSIQIDWGDGKIIDYLTSSTPVDVFGIPSGTIRIYAKDISYLDCSRCSLVTLDLLIDESLGTLICSENNLTLETLPSPNYDVYKYSSQAKITSLKDSYILDDVVDLSVHSYIMDAGSKIFESTFTWITTQGVELTDGLDYGNDGGYFYFFKEQKDSIYAMIKNPLFPDEVFITKTIFIGNAPQLSSITMASSAANLKFTLKSSAEIVVNVDWGDGSLEEFTVLPTGTDFSGTPKGTVSVYGDGITYLDCSSSNITSLDVSNCSSLTTLGCRNNELTNLNVSSNRALVTLICSINKLSTIDISANTDLRRFDCGLNPLNSLHLYYNPSLTTLECSSCELNDLDVSYNTSLQSLNCNSNNLSSLYVTNNPLLTSLQCHSNQLTSIDLSRNTEITTLVIGSNSLTKLDVSNLADLKSLSCSMNYLTIETLPEVNSVYTSYTYAQQRTMPMPQKVYAVDEAINLFSQYDKLDVNEQWVSTEYLWLTESGDTLKENIDYSAPEGSFYFIRPIDDSVYCKMTNAALPGLVLQTENLWIGSDIPAPLSISMHSSIDYIRFDLAALSPTMVYIDWGDGIPYEYPVMDYQTPIDGSPVGTIKIYGNGISVLKSPNCGLDYLNVSKSSDLFDIDCSFNSLTQFNISNNTSLEIVDCSNNQLADLDISQNKNMHELYCNDNSLTAIDLSNSNQLFFADCSNNKLKEINAGSLNQFATRIIKNNFLTIASLPVLVNDATVYYAPQYKMQLPQTEYYTGDIIDLSDQLYKLDINQVEQTTQYSWWTVSGDSLVAGVDYTGDNGLFSFIAAQNDSVYCKMTTDALPSLVLNTSSLLLKQDTTTTEITASVCYGDYYNGEIRTESVILRDTVISGNLLEITVTDLTVFPTYADTISAEINEGDIYVFNGRELTESGEYTEKGYTTAGCDSTIYLFLTVIPKPEQPSIVMYTDLREELHFSLAANQAELVYVDFGDGNLQEYTIDNAAVQISGLASDTITIYGNNITALTATNIWLTYLDVSKCETLYNLDCSQNYLDSLDISQNLMLASIYCSSNSLTGLDASANTELSKLICENNQITTLNITGTSALGELNCKNNRIAELDLSNKPALLNIYCDYNDLTSLDFSGTSGQSLSCTYNYLTISSLPEVNSGSFEYAQQKKMDLPKNQYYVGDKLDLSSELFRKDEEGTEQITEYALKLSDGSSLIKGEDYTVTDGVIEFLKEQTSSVYCQMKTSALPLLLLETTSFWIDMAYKPVPSVVMYTDSVGEISFTVNASTSSLAYVDWGDGVLNEYSVGTSATAITGTPSNTSDTIKIYSSNFTDISCPGIKLTYLDVSNCPSIQYLRCQENSLAYLNVSNASSLLNLTCYDNNLDTLDVSDCSSITSFDCHSNVLTSIDLSNSINLQQLNCSNNSLNSLDLSNNANLTELYCEENKLTIAELPAPRKLFSDYYYAPQAKMPLPQNEYFVGDTIDLSNQLYKLDTINVEQTTVYTWINQSDSTALEAGVDYTEENGVFVFLKASTDSIFCQMQNPALDQLLLETEDIYVSIGFELPPLTASMNSVSESISFYIESETDSVVYVDWGNDTLIASPLDMGYATISGFPADTIHIYGNGIKKLDVSDAGLNYLAISQNADLNHLRCNNNLLTNINISNNWYLRNLFCDYNKLTEFTIQGGRSLDSLSLIGNNISQIGITYAGNYSKISLDKNYLNIKNLPFAPIPGTDYTYYNQKPMQLPKISYQVGDTVDLSSQSTRRDTSLYPTRYTWRLADSTIIDPADYIEEGGKFVFLKNEPDSIYCQMQNALLPGLVLETEKIWVETLDSYQCTVDLIDEHQLIKGFGGINYPTYYTDLNADERELAFGNEPDQLGLTILRTAVSDNPDEWAEGIETAKRAAELGATLFASPWNPPASMTWNDNGQKRIDTNSFEAYAGHLNDYVSYMKANGAELYAISTQSEPDYAYEWTEWSPQESVDFIKDYADQIDCRIMTPESFQYRKDIYTPILNDDEALANVDIFGTHLYGTAISDFKYPLFEEKGAGKELWMTEVYNDYQYDANLWDDAVIDANYHSLYVAQHIHHAMVEGNFQAYVFWPIRRYYALIHDGNTAPTEYAGVSPASPGTITKRGWCMAHFSKFVRPGYVRVGATENPVTGVYVSAYKNGNSVVAVVINKNTSSQAIDFSVPDAKVNAWEQYVTSGTKSMSKRADINQSTSFRAILEPASVTTFVGIADQTTPPAVSIVSPLNNAVFDISDTITINAEALDQDGVVELVEFYVNDEIVHEDFEAPYSYDYSFDLAGDYTIKVIAFDDEGNSSTEDTISVSVNEVLTELPPLVASMNSLADTMQFTVRSVSDSVVYIDWGNDSVAEFPLEMGSGFISGSPADTIKIYGNGINYLDCSYSGLFNLELPQNTVFDTLICHHNNLSITSLPVPDTLWSSYQYEPQALIKLPPKVFAIGDTLDVSSQLFRIVDTLTYTTSYLWQNESGDTLTQGIDYEEKGGKFVFFDTSEPDSLFCEMSNELFPELNLLTENISIKAKPLALTYSVTQPVLCKGDSSATVSLKATGGVWPYAAYVWSDGDTAQVKNKMASGLYKVTVFDSNADSAVIKVYISEPSLLTTNLTKVKDAGCKGEANGVASVSAEGGAAPYEFVWSTGDTAIIKNQLAAGKYFVTVYDKNGCSAVDSIAIEESDLEVHFEAQSGCSPLTISDFKNSTIGAESYRWDFGDGTSSTEATPSHTYKNTAAENLDFRIKLTAESKNGCVLSHDTTITVYKKPAADFNFIGGMYTSVPVSFVNTGANFGYAETNGYWNYGDGNSVETATNPKHTYADSGSYEVSFTMELENGCTSTATQIITIKPAPAFSVIADGDVSFCKGDSVQLSIDDTKAFNTQWMKNGVGIADSTNQSILVKESGIYFAVMTSDTVRFYSDTIEVTAHDFPSDFSIQANGKTNICKGDSVRLELPASSAYAYTWTKDGVSLDLNSNLLFAKADGEYSALISAFGCETASDNTVSVEYDAAPDIPSELYVEGSTAVCEGQNVMLSIIENPNNYTLQWLRGNEIIETNTLEISIVKSGKYRLRAIDKFSCWSETDAVDVQVMPYPEKPHIQPPLTTTACFGETIKLVTDSIDGIEHFWKLNGNRLDGSLHIQQAKQTGKYTLENSNGACSTPSEDTVDLVFLDKPSAPSISNSGNLSFCESDSVVLTVPAVQGIAYRWLVNGKPTSNFSNTYIAKSSGKISVIATNENSCVDSSKIVAVEAVKIPEQAMLYSFDQTVICEGDSSELYTDAFSGIDYIWKYNNTKLDNNSNKLFAKQAGSYTVSLQAGECYSHADDTVEISVNPVPVKPKISVAGDIEFCEGGSVTLTTNVQSGVDYVWMMNNAETGADTSVLVADQHGMYTVKVSNEYGCFASADTAVQVTVNDLPQIPSLFYNSQRTKLCEGDTAILSASGNRDLLYYWKKDGADLNINNDSIIITESGKYGLEVGLNGCISKSENAVEFTFYNRPEIDIVLQKSATELCDGETAVLSVAAESEYDYVWFKNSTPVENETGKSLTVSESGNYRARVSRSDLECSILTDASNITVYEKPAVPYLIAKEYQPNVCMGNFITLLDTVAEGFEYSWYRNGIMIERENGSAIKGILEAGEYTLKSTNAICSSTSEPHNISYNSAPDKPSIQYLGNNEWYFSADVRDGEAYQWYLNDAKIPGAINFYYEAGTKLGTYRVAMKKEGECYAFSDPLRVPEDTWYYTTAIETAENLISISPNPNNGSFIMTINNNYIGNVDFEITDITGSIVQENSFEKYSNMLTESINMENASKGVYVVRITLGQEVVIDKLIVK